MAFCDICDERILNDGDDSYVLSKDQMKKLVVDESVLKAFEFTGMLKDDYTTVCDNCILSGYISPFNTRKTFPAKDKLTESELKRSKEISMALGRGENFAPEMFSNENRIEGGPNMDSNETFKITIYASKKKEIYESEDLVMTYLQKIAEFMVIAAEEKFGNSLDLKLLGGDPEHSAVTYECCLKDDVFKKDEVEKDLEELWMESECHVLEELANLLKKRRETNEQIGADYIDNRQISQQPQINQSSGKRKWWQFWKS